MANKEKTLTAWFCQEIPNPLIPHKHKHRHTPTHTHAVKGKEWELRSERIGLCQDDCEFFVWGRWHWGDRKCSQRFPAVDKAHSKAFESTADASKCPICHPRKGWIKWLTLLLSKKTNEKKTEMIIIINTKWNIIKIILWTHKRVVLRR